MSKFDEKDHTTFAPAIVAKFKGAVWIMHGTRFNEADSIMIRAAAISAMGAMDSCCLRDGERPRGAEHDGVEAKI